MPVAGGGKRRSPEFCHSFTVYLHICSIYNGHLNF